MKTTRPRHPRFNLRLATLPLALASLATAAAPAYAQQAEEGQMARVEITGSSIKRIQSETATPLTVFRAEEFVKQGLTTAQEVLDRIPSNQSSFGAANAVGGNASGLPTGGQATADLRGLGGDKTLVLLNGRRLATHPYDGASVDLNLIPVAALERVEVLRDGASAIYGTDAIGGVINFITKRGVDRATIALEATFPEETGGRERRANLTAGGGDLDRDRWTVLGVFDYHKQDVMTSQQRPFSATGVIPSRGLNETSGTPFPGNYFDPVSEVAGNPYFATGCDAPLSIPRASDGTCRQDYTRLIDNIPEQEHVTAYGKASMKVGADHTASVELLYSVNNVMSRTAPPPQTGLILPASSRWYPGNAGGVPAQPGLSGEPLNVSWRPTEAGQRQIQSKGRGTRLVGSLEGLVAGWDYQGGLSFSVSRSEELFTGGYVQDAGFAAGVLNGILNPFGLQDEAGRAYLATTALRGRVQDAKNQQTAFDFKASRELFDMAGGKFAVALGTELRHEKADFNVNRDIAGQAASSGLSGSLSKDGSRTIQAVFGEVVAPFMKNLEASLAARYDHYSDAGSTWNPKASLRFQPHQALVLRGSASTGFRAPTLFEKNAPLSRNDTSNSYDDPILCPGGVPQPGANPLRDCDLQQFKLQGGNPDLKPEKSRTFSVGAVFEPVPALTLAVDYWDIHLRDKIGALPEQTIFGNFDRYRDRFLRFPDGSPNAILDLNENLGKVETDGIDVSLTARTPNQSWGGLSFTLDGTWVHSYQYQNERDGEFIENVGRYADNYVVFRWRHNMAVTWRSGPWSATVAHNFKTRYDDQNLVDPEFVNRVSSYSLVNLSGTYTGFKDITLTAGVKNLFDKDPPFSNQGTVFQKGYDPRYTDPIGRALYLRGSYTF
ncbi:TonB-dependent receptor plug domain-containing protein [Pseudoduganella albidiflava]|uniref:TonB-dependent receptor n=1 Tax=Pseudoduganella albidiflava TaxID=321983 RepID=A0A411X2Y1_9BURK|nr:TonB-dependent receptor [Pseudoduganella albidiflava]QBI03349.1 TonB-dependent receptor [Pseudoduganella albidiflava]GGY66845.1 TonB-dependent receptor [Pseudoduganella albidiflava]